MERSRRAALFSVPPLWLIGVCLFLPTVRSCDHMESPAQLIRGGKWLFMSGMLAPFLLAELLAILIIVMLARGYVGKWIGRATLALVIGCAASPVILAVCDVTSHHLGEQAWALAGFGAVAAAAVVLWRARAVTAFARQAHYLAAFAFLNLPLALLLVRILVEDGRRNVGIGGWIYLGASATLAAIHARALFVITRE
jgi:hypothetical protein